MIYSAELNFFRKILSNMNLESHIVSDLNFSENIDHGLRRFLGISYDKEKMLTSMQQAFNSNVIYIARDEFMCNYILLILPDTKNFRVFICGPYINAEVTRQKLLENAEKYNIPPLLFSHLGKYYGNITHIPDETALFSLFNSLGEILWGNIENFSTQRLEKNTFAAIKSDIIKDFEEKSDESMLAISIIEARYEAERMLMEAVAKGHSHKVVHLISHASEFIFENRTQDNVRNTKNYMVVMNTLLRKAVQTGGVPPYFIDKLSSEFAKKIENSAGGKDTERLASEMVEQYSRLVKEHSIKNYSASVQKAMALIDYDLTADLSLKAIAEAVNMNPSYFSSLFRKETGKTYTEYVNAQRIENAQRLLSTTELQIQTVAQHCGLLDVNYFTKLFKKHTGKTPGQYRAER